MASDWVGTELCMQAACGLPSRMGIAHSDIEYCGMKSNRYRV